jgi:hypothetical protein
MANRRACTFSGERTAGARGHFPFFILPSSSNLGTDEEHYYVQVPKECEEQPEIFSGWH